MASDGTNEHENGGGGSAGQASHEPRECMACRGTGQVISNLGGNPSKVTCPWCDGQGVRVPGIDAQAHGAADSDGEDATPAVEPAA